MTRTSHIRVIAVLGSILLLTVAIAGCGRLGAPSDGAPGASSPVSAEVAAPAVASVASTAPSESPASAAPSDASAETGAKPAPTPDFASIESLLSGIDADLGADATATTDEGSPQ